MTINQVIISCQNSIIIELENSFLFLYVFFLIFHLFERQRVRKHTHMRERERGREGGREKKTHTYINSISWFIPQIIATARLTKNLELNLGFHHE